MPETLDPRRVEALKFDLKLPKVSGRWEREVDEIVGLIADGKFTEAKARVHIVDRDSMSEHHALQEQTPADLYPSPEVDASYALGEVLKKLGDHISTKEGAIRANDETTTVDVAAATSTAYRPPTLSPEQRARLEMKYGEVYKRLGKAAERFVEILNSPAGWSELDDIATDLESGASGLTAETVFLERTLTGWVGGKPEEWGGTGQAERLKEVFQLTPEDAQALRTLLMAPPEDRKRLAGALMRSGEWQGWTDEDLDSNFDAIVKQEDGRGGEYPSSMPTQNWERLMMDKYGISPDENAFKDPSSMSIELKRADELAKEV